MANQPDSGFDRVVSFYDRLARLVYGKALQQAQLALLPFVQPESRVLVIGGGSGWLLEQLCLSGKALHVLYLDASPKMIDRARRRFMKLNSSHNAEVEFRTGTENSLQTNDRFNIIITPFLLDLFPPARLQSLMEKLYGALTQEGRWLFVDFWPVAPSPPLWQRFLINSMYLFFGVVSGVKARKLPDYQKHFKQFRLKQVFSEAFFGGMVQAKVYQNQ